MRCETLIKLLELMKITAEAYVQPTLIYEIETNIGVERSIRRYIETIEVGHYTSINYNLKRATKNIGHNQKVQSVKLSKM